MKKQEAIEKIEYLERKIESMERSLRRESKMRGQAEAMLRRRSGDAVIAEAKAEYFKAQLIYEAEEKHSRLQEKCDAQRREINRLMAKVTELGG